MRKNLPSIINNIRNSNFGLHLRQLHTFRTREFYNSEADRPQ